jgi:hypothetical protein
VPPKKRIPYDNDPRSYAASQKRIAKAEKTLKGLAKKFGTKTGPKVPNLKKVSGEFLDIMQTHSPRKGKYREQAKAEIRRRQNIYR